MKGRGFIAYSNTIVFFFSKVSLSSKRRFVFFFSFFPLWQEKWHLELHSVPGLILTELFGWSFHYLIGIWICGLDTCILSQSVDEIPVQLPLLCSSSPPSSTQRVSEFVVFLPA